MAVDGFSDDGPGTLLELIRAGEAVTRADLARRTGLARSTVAHRVAALLALRLVYEAGERASTGGRPPTVLAFNAAAGAVLVADLGATRARVALCDLAGAPLVEEAHDIDITDGPEAVLAWLHERFTRLLRVGGRAPSDIRGIGIGLPGPIAFGVGQPVEPPIMPGWDAFSVPRWFARRYDAPVLVDNDVNLMALGEHRHHERGSEAMLFVKVGTGIGCGIIAAGGKVYRGAQGAAGDIGHIRVPGYEHVTAGAATSAASRRWRAAARWRGRCRATGRTGPGAAGTCSNWCAPATTRPSQAVQTAGEQIGGVLAGCVNFFNPGLVVIGGDLAGTRQLLDGVRQAALQRSLPLAARDLRIVESRLGGRAGVLGAAIMVTEHVLAPAAVNALLEPQGGRGSPGDPARAPAEPHETSSGVSGNFS